MSDEETTSQPIRTTPTIPGTLEIPDETDRLQQEVATLLDRRKRAFPGSQPVSFARKHLYEELMHEDYYVCEKSDGIRCLIYLTADPMGQRATYLITRGNEYYYVPNVHFPVPNDHEQFQRNCILDGELIISKKPDGSEALEYLMFDILVYQGKNLMRRDIDKRLGYLREFIWKPLWELKRRFPGECSTFEFQSKMKDMQLSSGLAEVIKSLPLLNHISDGLIFTPKSPYVSGTDPKLLKWKPPEENSVDFLLEMEFKQYEDEEESYPDYDSKPICKLRVWQGDKNYSDYGELTLSNEEWENLKNLNEPLQHRIMECNQDDDHHWRFMRFRDDKDNANHISTVEKVIESIQDRVDKQELIDAVPRIRANRKEREAKAAAARRGSNGGQQPTKRPRHE